MYGIIPALRAARGLILIVDIGALPHRRTSQVMGVFALRFGFWQQGRDAQQSGATNDPVMSRVSLSNMVIPAGLRELLTAFIVHFGTRPDGTS